MSVVGAVTKLLIATLPMGVVFLVSLPLAFIDLGIPYIHYWFSPTFHTLGGFVTGYAILSLLWVFGPWGIDQLHPVLRVFFVVSGVLCVGLAWEIAEFLAGIQIGVQLQPSIADTLLDLVLDCVGGLISCLIIGTQARR